jgi:hypothetical protein
LRSALVLWQIGVVGSADHSSELRAPRLPELVARLLELYPNEHEVVVYEASSFVGIEPLIRPVPLIGLAAAVTPASTLYVPPVEQP